MKMRLLISNIEYYMYNVYVFIYFYVYFFSVRNSIKYKSTKQYTLTSFYSQQQNRHNRCTGYTQPQNAKQKNVTNN